MKNELILLPRISVRNQQESVSALRRNRCPESAGISVRFAQESLSVLVKNMQRIDAVNELVIRAVQSIESFHLFLEPSS